MCLPQCVSNRRPASVKVQSILDCQLHLLLLEVTVLQAVFIHKWLLTPHTLKILWAMGHTLWPLSAAGYGLAKYLNPSTMFSVTKSAVLMVIYPFLFSEWLSHHFSNSSSRTVNWLHHIQICTLRVRCVEPLLYGSLCKLENEIRNIKYHHQTFNFHLSWSWTTDDIIYSVLPLEVFSPLLGLLQILFFLVLTPRSYNYRKTQHKKKSEQTGKYLKSHI